MKRSEIRTLTLKYILKLKKVFKPWDNCYYADFVTFRANSWEILFVDNQLVQRKAIVQRRKAQKLLKDEGIYYAHILLEGKEAVLLWYWK